MPIILRLTCSTTVCSSAIDGEEECHFQDEEPAHCTKRHFHGHMRLNYGAGLIEDLHTAALKAGWYCDGSRWLCVSCARAAIMAGRDADERMQRFLDISG